MFKEQKTIDQITVTENGIILIREKTEVLKDGVVIATSYHRTSLSPNDSLDGQDKRVVDIAKAVWTK